MSKKKLTAIRWTIYIVLIILLGSFLLRPYIAPLFAEKIGKLSHDPNPKPLENPRFSSENK